ncbi:MAG: hypothetical protein AAB391_04045 [Patescibacteria group bacterium]
MIKTSTQTITALSRTLALALIGSLLALALFPAIEPSFLVAATATDEVVVTLNVGAGISITSPADATMSTTIGISTTKAIATTTWNVKTNNAAGYTLALKSATSSTPAMKQDSDNTKVIADNTAGVTTPALWGSMGANTAEFGYSGYGTDVTTATYGSDSSCGATSTPSTALKYTSLRTTDRTLASRSSTTTAAGVDTVACYAVEQGSNFFIASGTYTATVTATATTQ